MKQHRKVYLIDTNVILRFLLADHEEFSPKATVFFETVSSGKQQAEILDIVVTECVYVLEKFYMIPKAEVVDKLIKILSFSGIVNADKPELLKALLNYSQSSVDIVDCILAAHTSPEKVVVSFDKDFTKLQSTFEQP